MGQGLNKTEAPLMGTREWIMLITLAILWGGSFFYLQDSA